MSTEITGPLFTKQTSVLSQVSRSTAVEMPVKFQSDTIIITPNLAASILHEFWR